MGSSWEWEGLFIMFQKKKNPLERTAIPERNESNRRNAEYMIHFITRTEEWKHRSSTNKITKQLICCS